MIKKTTKRVFLFKIKKMNMQKRPKTPYARQAGGQFFYNQQEAWK